MQRRTEASLCYFYQQKCDIADFVTHLKLFLASPPDWLVHRRLVNHRDHVTNLSVRTTVYTLVYTNCLWMHYTLRLSTKYKLKTYSGIAAGICVKNHKWGKKWWKNCRMQYKLQESCENSRTSTSLTKLRECLMLGKHVLKRQIGRDQESGIHCLIICGIKLLTPNSLGETWRRICSLDIGSVSALGVT